MVLLLSLMLFFTNCGDKTPTDSDNQEIVDGNENNGNGGNNMNMAAHLTINDYVRDIVNYPAFNGLGELLLSRDDNSSYYNTPISNVGSLMPYHGNVRPEVVVGSVNYMIDEVNKGKTIFYDIYTGQSTYSRDFSPSFITVAANDGIVNVNTVERRVKNLRKAGVKVEYHRYQTAGHGFGLGTGTDAEGWLDLAVRF